VSKKKINELVKYVKGSWHGNILIYGGSNKNKSEQAVFNPRFREPSEHKAGMLPILPQCLVVS
jgi:hypothetical protein